MDQRWTRRLAMALSIAAMGAVGCAQERAPINRVQADALEKSFFVGSLSDPSDDPMFIWRNFDVDGSEGQSLIGIGAWSGVDRIRWEVAADTGVEVVQMKPTQIYPYAVKTEEDLDALLAAIRAAADAALGDGKYFQLS